MECLSLISQKDDKVRLNLEDFPIESKFLIEKTLQRGGLILSEGERSGVIFNYSRELKEDKTFLLFKPRIELERFYEAMKMTYNNLLVQPVQRFVYIPVLREETCKILRIPDNLFDQLLTESAGKYFDELEFVRAPQRFGLRREAKFGKPIILYNVPYYLIRVK
jgi:hypothetical protein